MASMAKLKSPWFMADTRTMALSAVFAGLSGCSSVPETPQPIDSTCAPVATTSTAAALPRIELQGQLSIKLGAMEGQPAKGLSLGFFFAGNTQTGQLDLMTLMGSQMAKVNWSQDQAWLVNDKGTQQFNNLDDLSQNVLGETLPLRALAHWMQGQPDPSLSSQIGTEPDTFIQAGWIIDAREINQKKLYAQRPLTPTQRAVQIKIYLDR